ncbi:SOS response-associated peptidase family protein, partial [Mesorhizobium sp. M2D.F.Ca.ET.140.01.1.1]|uniref:SOS response-associated peptidase family protein n=1 Tax=Mesorhizobium sp. M2D.F.Ca.ET.140.01.1.1 TaxID=2496664 RepID=UPI001FE0D576
GPESGEEEQRSAIVTGKPVVALDAGFWTRWQGIRKVKDGPGDFELFAFMTTKPNALIAPIHEKAMPVILTTSEETEAWLTAP